MALSENITEIKSEIGIIYTYVRHKTKVLDKYIATR
jgi:hypothetical protein